MHLKKSNTRSHPSFPFQKSIHLFYSRGVRMNVFLCDISSADVVFPVNIPRIYLYIRIHCGEQQVNAKAS